MTTKDNALRMAIEALEYHTEQTRPIQKTIDALALCKAALSDETVTSPEQTAKQEYDTYMQGLVEPSAIERLRFFCSLSMSGQDWLDVEPFFNDLIQEKPVTLPDGWVSVEDRLPKVNERVLLCTSNQYICDGYLKIRAVKHKSQRFSDGYGTVFNVTHWMPLPSAPTCEKEKG
jgi:hypothetical protein